MLKSILTPDVIGALLGLMATVLTVATPLIVLYARRAYRKVAEATGVQVEEAQLRKLDELIMNGIGGAEEYAIQAAKVGLHYSSNAKLEHAIKLAREFARDGLQAYTDEQLKTVAEAKMPVARARMSTRPPPEPTGLPRPPTGLLERL